MALAFSSLAEGIDTTNNPSTTASVNPTAGSVTYACLAFAVAGGGTTVDADTVVPSGARGTWTFVAGTDATTVSGLSRRGSRLYRGTGSVTNEAITITATTGLGTWTETAWNIIEVTGQDATPDDTPQVNGAESGTSGEITTSLGTAGTGDRVMAFWFHENDEAVTATGLTLLGSGVTGGSDIRTLHVFYDASDPQDDTPAASWSTTGTWGAIGLIVNVASGGTTVNARNGIALSGITAINGVSKATLSAINGQTLA